MSRATNPPAFPSVCLGDPGHPASVPGMTLRDWFAGQALASFSSRPMPRDFGDGLARYYATQAAVAYSMADAMLEARAALSKVSEPLDTSVGGGK